jgi:hypothetical protein
MFWWHICRALHLRCMYLGKETTGSTTGARRIESAAFDNTCRNESQHTLQIDERLYRIARQNHVPKASTAASMPF